MTEIKEPKKTYRLSVDLSIRKKELLYRIIPWGQRNSLLVKVINLALVFFAKHGFASAYDALENDEVEIRFKRNKTTVIYDDVSVDIDHDPQKLKEWFEKNPEFKDGKD